MEILKSMKPIILVGLFIFGTLGCVSTHLVDIEDKGIIKVELSKSKYRYVKNVSVYMEGDEMIVSGSVVPSSSLKHLSHHVHITIIGPAGNEIDAATVQYKTRLGATARRQLRNFSARFNLTPPHGTTVRVLHHVESH